MAGRNIKGITVEIGGDTTGLQKALKEVNSEIKNTQSQLKDVEKLLKMDPGNTELLTQKQKLLSDAVKETREKLETLKTAAEQANTALANGDISQEQYDALQREIIETEQALKDLETQAGQSETALQKVAATGEKMQELGDKISGVGTKLMPVTTAIVGLGTAAVKTASDFDSAISQVAAVSGAAGDELEALSDKAREMGEKTKFSASEAAEAMNYMAMAGWKTSDMLDGIEGIMYLAAASGEELATTSDIVTDALSAFGLTAADSGHFADVLAAASSNANTNVSMMGETFKYCAPVAGALGYTIDDVAEAIGLMANSGIKSSQAGTALRTILTKLQGELTLTGAGFGEVTIQTANTDGSMRELSDILADCRTAFSQMTESEAAAAAETLVGKNAMSGFLALMQAAPEDIEKLSSAIANCDGTAESMATTMQDNLEGQLTILKSQLEELAISFGEMLMPVIRDIVTDIQSFVEKLNNMDEGTRKVILTVALVVAALGPVLIIIGKLVTAIGTIMTVIPKIGPAITAVKTAFAGLNAVMAANPIVLIIAAIAALVAAFIYLWNNCEGFRQFWIDLWEGLKNVVSTVVEAIKTFFTGVIDFVKTNWQSLLLMLVNPFLGAFKLLYDNCDGFRDFINNLWENIKTITENVWNSIKDFFAGLWDGIKSTAETAWNSISETASSIWTGMGNFFTGVWEGIRDNPVLSSVTDTICSLWENFKITIQGIWNGIKEIASGAWEMIKNVILGPVLLLIDIITGNFTQLQTDASNIWMNIQNAASTIWGGIKDTVGSYVMGLVNHAVLIFTGFKDTLSLLWTSISETATTVWTAISGFFTTIWEGIKLVFGTAFEFIGNLITTYFEFWIALFTGDWETIKQIFSDAWTAISENVTAALTAISEFLTEMWTFITEGVSLAWTTITETISTAATNIWEAVTTAFTDMWNELCSIIDNIYNTIATGFNNAADFIRNLVSSAASWGADFVGNFVSGILSRMHSLLNTVISLANRIRSYLHFSEPDKGPLSDFHKWMPDFMEGLAEGIEKSRYLVQDAVSKVSADMVINPKANYDGLTGLNASSGKSVIQHTGTIRVEGVSDEGMLTSVVDLLVDKMRMEARC